VHFFGAASLFEDDDDEDEDDYDTLTILF